MNHVLDFKESLHLAGAQIRAAAPFLKPGKDGVQIDLLIQTPRSVYVVEVKRCNRIEPSIEREIEEKVSRLGIGPEKSVRTVLVYDGKLSPEVEENGFIDYLIPFDNLVVSNTDTSI